MPMRRTRRSRCLRRKPPLKKAKTSRRTLKRRTKPPEESKDTVEEESEDVDMEQPEQEAPPQPEERDADEGAQNDELEAPSKGANVQDDQQNAEDANAKDEEETDEQQSDEGKKSAAKQRNSSKGTADAENAAESASAKDKADPKEEEVSKDEPTPEAAEKRPHVQPREDEDEAMNVDRPDAAVIADPRKYASLSDSVALMASELAENLRQILEPSIANRLQGDYRTGKRLNMRRLVSYIASDYRKNRIWLRRTKKLQRNFQIMIAVDDSQSMGDNRMGEITSQSLCLIEKAFRQLEVGQLAICKFGQHVQMLRDFASAADAQDTLIPSLLENLTFTQNKTDLIGLLSYASRAFQSAKETTPASSLPVQMLVVIGDGHGVFSQGRDPVMAAIKGLEADLYVIVDGKNSILKMSFTSFQDGRPVMTPYIGVFPFPFYALVRSVSTLPGTLAEAIRQWLEMAMQE